MYPDLNLEIYTLFNVIGSKLLYIVVVTYFSGRVVPSKLNTPSDTITFRPAQFIFLNSDSRCAISVVIYCKCMIITHDQRDIRYVQELQFVLTFVIVHNFSCFAKLKATDNACMIQFITKNCIFRSKKCIKQSNVCMVTTRINYGIFTIMKLCYLFF